MSVTETRRIQGFGWRPSLPDHRDLIADPSEIRVRSEVDPRGEYMTPVYDQGELGSCTANAVVAAIDAYRIANGGHPAFPARLVIYALERIIEGQALAADSGAYGRDGFKAARKYGWLPEGSYPYSVNKIRWSHDPRPELRAAEGHPVLEAPYKAVRRRLSDFRRVLSNRQTIAFGFSVYESFEESWPVPGLMPVPGPDEQLLGGHEVLMVGYLREEPLYALCRNSWGEEWGDGGYFLMPWSVLLDPQLSSDFRTIYRPL